jgi:hypothetical protein
MSESKVAHLALGSDPNVTLHWSVRWAHHGLLNAQVSQCIFTKDGACVKIGSHETTFPRKSLKGVKAPIKFLL